MYLTDIFPFISSFFFVYVVFTYTPFSELLKIDSLTYNNKIGNKIIQEIGWVKPYLGFEEFETKTDSDSDKSETKEELKEEKKEVKEIKYEDKYLEKYLAFSNNYIFTEEELVKETEEKEKIKEQWETNLKREIINLQKQLAQINPIVEEGINEMNDEVISKMVFYFNIEDSYADDPSEYDIDELFNDMKRSKNELNEKLDELLKCEILNFEALAREKTINDRLDKYINNYILEQTPLGNVYMRYNNSKKSFEYFSNSTIPYRYLETLGRKYVMTYWCKPLFVDLAEELKKAEQKQSEKKDITEPIVKAKPKPKPSFSSKSQMLSQPVNQQNNQVTNIKPELNTNSNTEPILLKENANRYTWEGRLSNLMLLKKPPKKSETLSFAEFKLLQKQNKKIK